MSKRIIIWKRAIIGGMAALTLGIGGSALAQSAGGADRAAEEARLERVEEKLDRRVEKMTEKLGLSEAQAKKIRGILDTAAAERGDIVERAGGDRKAARGELKALRKKVRGDIRQVLTPEQQAQAKTMFKGHKKGRHGKKGHHRRMGKRLDKMKAELALSEAQSEKIEGIFRETRQANRALIEGSDGDRSAVRPQLKANRKAAMARVRAQLTPEQQAKFDAWKAERKERRGKRGARH